MKKRKKIFRFGELFAGPGGLALGAVSAKVSSKDGTEYSIVHEWANDYDADSCITYRNNLAHDHTNSVICDDVRKLDLSKLGEVDIFAYGFPCNDFSIVGEQKGFHGTFGPLYSYGVTVLNLYKPRVFVAENVSGLSSANQGSAFKKIINDLSKAGNGYEITAHLYKAEDYGVPQTRHRIIIVGLDKKLGLKFKVPAPTHKGKPITVREAFENPLIPADAFNHDLKKQSAIVVERLKHIKPGQNAWTADLPMELRLNVKNAKLSQIYKRLDPNKPSYTITGSGGGGTHGYHYAEPRALTNRERARIQTFPDGFKFEGSNESVRKQVGMAVPPRLANIVFTSILKTLAGIDYSNTQASIM